MTELRILWGKFKNSQPGWIVIVTVFAVLFGLVASLLTGLISLPALMDESFKYTDEVISFAFPAIILGLSLLVAKQLAKKRAVKVSEIVGWKRPKKKALWLTPLLLVIYVILLVLAMSILQALSPNLAGQEQEVAETVSNSANWSLLVMVISVGVITPIAEETFFRGLLLKLYSRKLKVIISIILTALLFGLAHGQLNVGLDTFLFGIILGVLSWKTESIYPAISLHMLKNCLAIVAILSS